MVPNLRACTKWNTKYLRFIDKAVKNWGYSQRENA